MSGASPPAGAAQGGAGISVVPVTGVPEVRAGDDLAALITARVELTDGDVVVVSQKVVSKAEGALVWPEPGEDRTAARRRLAREQAVRVVAEGPGALVVETRQGLVCANAGIDASNVPDGAFLLLPADPDASARALRAALRAVADVAVIVADTFGRPWRVGVTDVAIGVAGLPPLRDERGTPDRQGAALEVTQVAVADELAAAADLVRRKADGIPVVVVRGHTVGPGPGDGTGTGLGAGDGPGAVALQRSRDTDLFPRGRGGVTDALGAHEPRPGPVDTADLDRAAAAARRVGGAGIRVTVTPGELRVSGPPLDAGAAAGSAIAALVDLGYAAARRAPAPGDSATVVVVAGPPGEPRDDRGR